MTNVSKLTGAIKFALFVGTASMAASGLAFAQDQEQDQKAAQDTTTLDRIQVTGSRIKRADVEGALPVTVINRADIEVSGKVSVAELLQSSTFNSFGSFVPSSGSSAQSFSELSLRGLGGGRTLILIDGRRAPTSPQTGEGQDLNTVPLAAVERVEILTDGASAIYGADAMGGVVNIITRKDFNGAEITYGMGQSEQGGDTEQASAIFGTSGERGRMIGGASYNSRGITFNSDLPWVTPGASSYSNNYYNFALDANGNRAPTSRISAVPGGCTNEGFYLSGSTCLYNFNLVAADTASIDQKGLFARGDYQINDNWNIYFSGNVSRVESFGRFAPTPEYIFLAAGTPNNTTGKDVLLKHRFAALGPRDNFDDTNVYDFNAGFNWQATDGISVDFGIRRNESRFVSHGYNYVSIPKATELFNSGAYDAFDPAGNPESVLNEIRTTTSRDGHFSQDELYAVGNFDLFQMAGGTSVLALGAEYREEDYADIYDQQSAAGNVGGSSGNSAFGDRKLTSAYGEWILPILSNFEVDLAARYDKYSDFGNSTSPKISLRYQPLDSLTLRASYGEGFRAPSLAIMNQQDAFSADSVVDAPTAIQLGVRPTSSIQINGLRVATPDLEAEESKQYSFGAVWDATDWLNLTADYYNIEIENQVKFYSAQTVINRTRLGQFLPSHLYVTRDPVSQALIQVRAGYGNEGLIKTDGVDLAARTNFDLGEWGRIRNNLTVSYVNKYEVSSLYTNDDLVNTSDVPSWRAVLTTIWDKGDFSAAWTINAIDYTPEYYVELFDENYGYSCQETVDAGYAYKCGDNYITHDVQFSYNAPWNGKFTVGAQNVTNKKPRLDQAYTPGYNNALYNAYGRQVYFRYQQSF